MTNAWKCREQFFSQKSFPRLDFLKAVSVTMIANSEKMKMKKSHPTISVSPTDFLKNFLPEFFGKLHPPL